jgi:hypothetical protein
VVFARSRALLAAGSRGAVAIAVLAMIWMTVRRPLAAVRGSDRPPRSEAHDVEPDGRNLAAVAGFAAVALAAVAVMAAIGLRGYGSPEPAVRHARVAPPVVRADEPQQVAKRAKTRRRAPTRRLFAAASVWNRRLPPTARADPFSVSLVAALGAEVERELAVGTGPGIATVRVYEVGARQQPVRVRLDAQEAPALKRAFAAVPIPRRARPAGPQRQMTVWQPSRDRLWELSGARRRTDRWHAQWGGALRRVSKSPGYYGPSAWPGATLHWGASGSGLPLVAGAIRSRDLERGWIDHALAIGLPAPRAGAFAWPAQRTDGTGPVSALPEGARLRLDKQLRVGTLRLPPLARMIARAAKRYGLIVSDRTDGGITFFAERPLRSEALARFPWERLEVLELRLCSTAPCGRG